jgi:Rad3-related DNA helicase
LGQVPDFSPCTVVCQLFCIVADDADQVCFDEEHHEEELLPQHDTESVSSLDGNSREKANHDDEDDEAGAKCEIAPLVHDIIHNIVVRVFFLGAVLYMGKSG